MLLHDSVHDENYCYKAYYLGNLITSNKHPYVVSGSLFQEIHSGDLEGRIILGSHGTNRES
jgi:hypothetical protein